MFIEENQGVVNNIYLCDDLKVENPQEKEMIFCFGFYEDEKVTFKPSVDFIINLQKADKAIEDFYALVELGLIPYERILNWHYRTKELADDLDLGNALKLKEYKSFLEIDELYTTVKRLKHNYDKKHIAQEALDKYNKIDQSDERSIIKWLLEHENFYIYSLKKTKNWKKTGILILETEPNLVIDCSECIESFIFDDTYRTHLYDIMEKYEPTNEHYEQHLDGIECDLKTYLKLHNKYLDLF